MICDYSALRSANSTLCDEPSLHLRYFSSLAFRGYCQLNFLGHAKVVRCTDKLCLGHRLQFKTLLLICALGTDRIVPIGPSPLPHRSVTAGAVQMSPYSKV
jgi:hypothetical protein